MTRQDGSALPDPPATRPPGGSFLSGTKGLVTVIGGLVAIVGTIVTTFLAVHDRPAPYRLSDWSQAANATCDQRRAAVSAAMGRVDTAIQTALSSVPPDIEEAAQQTEAATDHFKELIGAVRAIRLPGERRDDVLAVFRLADELDARYYDVADLIRKLNPADLTAEPLRSQLLTAFERVDEQHAAIADAFRDLGATSCAMTPQ